MMGCESVVQYVMGYVLICDVRDSRIISCGRGDAMGGGNVM